uniref:U6 snRNA-associated Sm-like protein LSm1 n=1 Tax=Salmo salar TaxID=8030 RepID=B5XFP3_SALSA|nr:U6 snRNA-associated Sm-like protein LSm1 [Salmo salar]
MNYMPGTASLIDDIDKKHLVLLRDGRTLIGFLRSIDQFANLVFHQTVERIHVGKKFGDIPRGIFIVRGESVVLLGEIDMDKPCDTVLQQVSIEEILEEQRLQQQAKQETEKAKVTALKDRGLSIPKADNLDEYRRHFCSIFLRYTRLPSSMLNRGLFWRWGEECVVYR